MTVFAYLRVSTSMQTLENQRNNMQALGFTVDRWFEDDAVSGTTEALKRKGLSSLLAEAKSGDTIIAGEVSRLGRNVLDVLNFIDLLKKRGIKLRIANLDCIDLTSPTGALLLTMMLSCAQFERDLLVERVKIGIKRTVAEGTVLGKLDKLSPEALVDVRSGKLTHAQYASKYGVSTKTIQRAIKKDVETYKSNFVKKVSQQEYNKNFN